jgi:hypothetical protein
LKHFLNRTFSHLSTPLCLTIFRALDAKRSPAAGVFLIYLMNFTSISTLDLFSARDRTACFLQRGHFKITSVRDTRASSLLHLQRSSPDGTECCLVLIRLFIFCPHLYPLHKEATNLEKQKRNHISDNGQSSKLNKGPLPATGLPASHRYCGHAGRGDEKEQHQ